MSTSATGPLVVVTGASGYVAGPIVDLLIKKGYQVRGTVRSLSDDKAKQLQKDFPSIKLFEADLTKEGSFKEAIEGTKFVFHTASPFARTWKDPHKDFIEPAVNGTANVLTTALSTPSVEKIVVTSSCATIFDQNKPENTVFDDQGWTTSATVEQSPYALSKVLAEKKAWELVDQHNSAHPDKPVKLITILPSVVLGPPIGNRVDGVSVNTIVNLLDESQVDKGVGVMIIPDVDVRDVAAAHVAAVEVESANGRYVLSGAEPHTHLDYVSVLKEHLPNRQYPSKLSGEIKMKKMRADHSRTERELGIKFIPWQQSVKDQADKLIQLGLVKA